MPANHKYGLYRFESVKYVDSARLPRGWASRGYAAYQTSKDPRIGKIVNDLEPRVAANNEIEVTKFGFDKVSAG